MMDQTLENSYQRQFRVLSYFSNNDDQKLRRMNMQEEVSQWSDSIKKIQSQTKKQKRNSSDFSDLLQQSNQQCEISSCKDIYQKSNEHQGQQYLSNRCIANDDLFGLNSNCLYQQEDTNIFFSPYSPKSYIQMMGQKSTDIKQNTYRLNKECRKTEVNSQRQKCNSDVVNHHQLSLQKLNISALTKIKFYIMKFYKNNTIFGITKLLSKKTRSLIGDKSDIIVTEQTSINYLSYKINKYYFKYFKWLYNMPLLNVHNNLGFFIQILFTLLNCLFLYLFTLIFVFNGFADQKIQIYYWVKIIWILEIVMQLNTAPYYINSLKRDRKSIFQNYFKQKSLYDITPLIVLSIKSENNIFQIIIYTLIFLKVINVTNDLSYLQKRICMKVKRYYIIQIFNLVFQLFLIGHVISCFWYMLAQIEYNIFNLQYSWFDDLRENTHIWWNYYIWALYWSLTLMTTGSNTANTILQASFTTIILLFTTISFGYFLNAISIILSEMDENLQQKRKDVNTINEFMRQKNISQNLQAEVNIDLEYYYINNFKKICEDNDQVFDKISVDLRNSLQKEYNKQILSKISFLNKNFSQDLIEELSLSLQEEYYLPNQIIQKESDKNNNFLMYIITGEVELTKINDQEGRKNKNNPKLLENQIYGEINFFTGEANIYYLKSVQFTKILRIDRNKFLRLLQDHQRDFEIFCSIKDKLSLYQDYSCLNQQCLTCNSSNHSTQDCLYLHFDKRKAIQRARFLENSIQERKSQERKSRKSIQTIIDMKRLQDIAKQARFLSLTKQSTSNRIYTAGLSSTSSEEEQDKIDSTANNNNNTNGYDVISIKAQEQEQNRKTIQKIESENFQSNKQISVLTQEINTKTLNKLASSHNSFGSINEVEDQGIESMKNYLKDQSELYTPTKIQSAHDSLKKFYSESVKNLKKDSYDMLRPINYSEIYSIFKESQENEQNQVYQKLISKMKLNKKSILKKTQRQSLKSDNEDKTDICRSLKKLFKKVSTDIRDDDTEENHGYSLQQRSFECLFEPELYDNILIWEFDQQKDFTHYFESGNLKYSLYKINRFLKRKTKKQTKKMKK